MRRRSKKARNTRCVARFPTGVSPVMFLPLALRVWFQNLFRNRFSATYRALYTGGEYELNVTSPPRPACQVPWLPEP